MPVLLGLLLLYVVLTLAVGAWAARRVVDAESFAVAGRRLPFPLATATLLATWFGAGTLLVAADEVAASGLSAIALDPLGAGLCLLLAGVLMARPLWEMELVTLSDFFGRRFGPTAERASAVLMVPGYFGWIAAQLTALAALVELYFGLPIAVGLPLVAAFAVAYTWMGGLWAVALTDALQLVLVVVGCGVMFVVALHEVGNGSLLDGLFTLWTELPPERRALVPAGEALPWLGVLAAGALGNLPGQDLTQRIFAARSAATAQWACVAAGSAYLVLGAVPVLLGLGARRWLTDVDSGILVALAHTVLHPAVAAVWVLAVVSAVLSTVDSAMVAPAAVLARNLAVPVLGRPETLGLHRSALVLVGASGLVVAWIGEDAWSVLEASYELGLVSLMVPLLGGLYWPASERTALATMAVGTVLWGAHLLAGSEVFLGTTVPVGLGATGAAAGTWALGRMLGQPAAR